MADSYYTSQKQETPLEKIPTKGDIPDWLNGKLVRNGPAIFESGEQPFQHWFDGFGMLHGFLFDKGQVYYQSKIIRSPEYLKAQETGRVSTVTWGTASDPCRSIFRRFFANFTASATNTPVNVIKIGSKYYSTSDTAVLNEFDIRELDLLSTNTVAKQTTMAAHPAFSSDGSVWNMTSKFGPAVKNSVVSIDEDAQPTESASFNTKQTYYFHSFANTDRYFVTIEQPLYLSFKDLIVSGVAKKSFYECFSWDDQATNIFHVYDRETDTMQHITSHQKFFYFHTINAYAKDDQLVIDLAGYDSPRIIDDFYLDNFRTKGIQESNKASLRQIKLDLKSETVEISDLGVNLELPAINYSYGGRQYRYAYGGASAKGSPYLTDGIIKYDFATGKHAVWHEEDMVPGEPVFVARPESIAEDDGVLLITCHHKATDKAALVILDAATLRVVGSAEAPRHVPASLHGAFYNLDNL